MKDRSGRIGGAGVIEVYVFEFYAGFSLRGRGMGMTQTV